MGEVIPFPGCRLAPLAIDLEPRTIDALRHLLRERLLNVAQMVIVSNVLRGVDSDPDWKVSPRVRDRIEAIVSSAWAEGRLA